MTTAVGILCDEDDANHGARLRQDRVSVDPAFSLATVATVPDSSVDDDHWHSNGTRPAPAAQSSVT